MEQQFLYGHHVLKSGLGRITENTPRYQGVIVLSMSDVPLVGIMSLFVIKYPPELKLILFYFLFFFRALVRLQSQLQSASIQTLYPLFVSMKLMLVNTSDLRVLYCKRS